MIKKICIIVNNYPNCVDRNKLVFVQQLVWEWSDLGIDCVVICPIATNIYPSYKRIKYFQTEKTTKGNTVKIFSPHFFGFGQKRKILGIKLARLTTYNFTKKVFSTIKKERINFDCVYGHFITPSGICAAKIGKFYHKPSFLAYGEATTGTINQIGLNLVVKLLANLKGCVAVSSKNKKILVENGICKSEIIDVFPNGFREDRFFPKEKILCRNRFGLPKDKFIVGFVGSFDERKGIMRLQKAVDNIPEVYFIAAGKGKLQPTSKKCLFFGEVDNNDLVDFYNSMDAFVLPTRNEGCCNAIIEAIACGLPIISSNSLFNDDILENEFAIRIDCDNVNEIISAIKKLKNKKIRNSMSISSNNKAKELKMKIRAKNILDFLENKSIREIK